MSIRLIAGIDIFLRPLSEKLPFDAGEISAMILKLKLFSTKKIAGIEGFRIQDSRLVFQ
jgi:hypothetical protein